MVQTTNFKNRLAYNIQSAKRSLSVLPNENFVVFVALSNPITVVVLWTSKFALRNAFSLSGLQVIKDLKFEFLIV